MGSRRISLRWRCCADVASRRASASVSAATSGESLVSADYESYGGNAGDAAIGDNANVTGGVHVWI